MGLMWSKVKVKERVWTTWHRSVRIHGGLVVVLLAGRGFEAARVESWPSARWN